MAIGIVFDAPGFTQAQYEQVRKQVVPDNRLPQGMLSHVAGPTDNSWCVVEVWESQEASQRFFDEKLNKALQEAGFGGQVRFFQVYNTMEG